MIVDLGVVRDLIEAGLNWPADAGTALWVLYCGAWFWCGAADDVQRCDDGKTGARETPVVAQR
jgi:hypothetical protein